MGALELSLKIRDQFRAASSGVLNSWLVLLSMKGIGSGKFAKVQESKKRILVPKAKFLMKR